MMPKCRKGRRRGVVLVEAGLVYSIAISLVIATIVVGLGSLRYQQLTWLTREGARWASLHGPDYQTAHSGTPPITGQDVVNDAIARGISPFTANELTPTLTWDTTSKPKNVIYQLEFTWTPQIIPGSIKFTTKSTQAITY
jgi:hypothetical protein